MNTITCNQCSTVALSSQSFSRNHKTFCSKQCMNKGCASELALLLAKEEKKAKENKQIYGTYHNAGGFC